MTNSQASSPQTSNTAMEDEIQAFYKFNVIGSYFLNDLLYCSESVLCSESLTITDHDF